MSNSFNISVKPDIAALEAKVDIIDTEVGLIKTDSAAILIDTAEMQPKLPTSYIMGSSNVDSYDAQIEQVVAITYDIEERTSNLPDDPASNTEVNANETKIDSNKVVVDAIQAKTDIIGATVALETGGNIAAIKAKTDLIPQDFRGSLNVVAAETVADTYVELCNVSGQGKLIFLMFLLDDAGDTITIRVTLDGTASTEFVFTGDTNNNFITIGNPIFTNNLLHFDHCPESDVRDKFLHLEFNTSLVIEFYSQEGEAAAVYTKAGYIID